MYADEDYDETTLLEGMPKFLEVDFTNYVREPQKVADIVLQEEILEGTQPVPVWEPVSERIFEALVEKKIEALMADDVARGRIREMKMGVLPEPSLVSFSVMASQDFDDELLTINHLWPRGGNVLLAAQAKAGKSTLVANLIRALLDGTPFLGSVEFGVTPIPEGSTLALLDLEMNERRIVDEIGAQQIQNHQRLRVQALRGKSQSFDIMNDEQRVAWIKELKDNHVHTLIVDPIAPLLAQIGVDESDNFGVTQLFNMLDNLKREAGITDMLVVHHCGHSANWRPRGASRFNDWPDAIWMIRLADGADEMDPDAERQFYAKGRDVGLHRPGTLILQPDKRLRFEENDAPINRRDERSRNEGQIEQALVDAGAAGLTAAELESVRVDYAITTTRLSEILGDLVTHQRIFRALDDPDRPLSGRNPYRYWISQNVSGR